MTDSHSTATKRILVAIDIAKAKHDVLVELPSGARKKMIVRTQRDEFQQLAAYLKSLNGAVLQTLVSRIISSSRLFDNILKDSIREV